MNYSRINNLTGWGVFLAALTTYLLTVAPTASFWDCGEFIACANELEVTHPPGAPLFLLLGRIFAMFAMGPENVAFMVNLLSATAGAFTALFTCWTVTMLASKGIKQMDGLSDQAKTFTVMAAGVIAGLSCTFADSVWFNSVEAEVYSMSSFFTAIVVWLIFKWEARADEPDHLRWIVLIAYIMGLSIGVHLLNLLTIPALAAVYYFRKFDFSWKGFIVTMGIAVFALALIQYGIIQTTFSIAWGFEKFFTGTQEPGGGGMSGLGFPMGTGSTIFGLLVVSAIVFLIYFSQKKQMLTLNVGILAFTVILIGFSSYTQIFVRSNANPGIDMNNPENVITFLSYMKREQYGDRPLVRGPLYNAQVERDRQGYAVAESKTMKYVLLEGSDRYVEDTEDIKYAFKNKVWFPRMYDPNHYNTGTFAYKNFVQRRGSDAQSPYDDRPTRAEDFQYFLSYQLNHMYIRYFLWNFAGRESDMQDAAWESGFERGQTMRWTAAKMRNKGKNHFYMLPLFFGLLGVIWQILYRKRDAAVIGMLFFFTGIAIVLYLNQYAPQPRERDYSYAGSFQTFSIWIGLGVLFLVDVLRRPLKNIAPYVAAGVVFIAPLLMGVQGWDDHSRKDRWIDIEFAKNLLNSCAPNAILFTGGDNDTFPLWYIQEVEGYRSDVRVVNLELLISDWYIEQMQSPKNESPALPITMEKKDYAGEKGLVMQGIKAKEVVLPTHKSKLVQDGVLSTQEASWIEGDNITWQFKPRGSSRNPYILRKDSVILNLVRNIANQGWERPVYFANTMQPSSFVQLQDYFRMEGLAYRVVPVKKSANTPEDIFYGWIGQDQMYENLTEKFLYTKLDDPAVNFDEHIRQVIVGNYRNAFYRLANSYAGQISKWNTESVNLGKLLQEEGANIDSIQTVRAQYARQIESNRTKIGELLAFSEAKMPHSVIHRTITLMISQCQMLANAGLQEQALAEYANLEADALDYLRAQKETQGRKFNPGQNNYYLQGLLLATQYYARVGQDEKANNLATELQTLLGNNVGQQLIQQEKSRR
ncbi:MAG: DUF2723 domain-containing protein [Bacteroidota bacterium]